MTTQPSRKPWHEVVQLRDDVRSGELSLAVFAADLYDVVMQKGQRPVYEQPAEFFALTYPTYNLRELVKDVVLRLAGQSDKAYRKLSVNYGGGKTHTLIALRHLVHDPDTLPDVPAVQEFEAHIGFKASEGPDRGAVLRQDRPGKRCRDARAGRRGPNAQTPVEHSGLSTGRVGRSAGSFTPTARTPSERPRRRNRWWWNFCQSRKRTVSLRWCCSMKC